MDERRTLVLIRHARAESGGPSDLERRLSDGGAADARAGGAWLARRGTRPDLALVSAAERAIRTWQETAAGADWDADLASYDPGLYAAGPETVLDLVRGVSDDVRTLVVVGHNPTIGVLAQQLDDGDGDVEASNAMATGYPTGATTLFEVDGSWADLAQAGGRVVAFHVPRA